MPDSSQSIIESIHTKLDALLVDAGGSAVLYGIGSIPKNRNTRAPRIIWYDHDSTGEIIPLKRSTTNPRRWAEDSDEFKVQIWCIATESPTVSARQNCQFLLHNLILATRREVGAERGYGVETVLFGGYAKSLEGQDKLGMALTVDVSIITNVTNDLWATVSVAFEGCGVILPSEETPMDILQEFTSEFTTEFTS